MIRHLPPSFGVRAAMDAVAGPFRPNRSDSFAAEVSARLGPTVANTFYAPYAKKLYGVPASELDAELAKRRVSASSPVAIARRLVRASRPAGRTFLYPRNGYGQISERLAEAAASAGADIRLNSPAGQIVTRPDGVTVEAAGRSFAADIVLSTMPLARLANIIEPQPGPQVLAAADRCRTRAMLLVYLVLEQDQYTPFDAHYLPDENTTVARLSEPKNYRDGPDPTGRTVLCAEIACWQHDDIWSWSDDDLGSLVASDLQASGLPRPMHVHAEVRRLGSVYPVLEKATVPQRAELARWAGSVDRVVTLGRQGLGVLDNLHHVLAMGAAASDAITAAGSIDRDQWNRALAAFASHVVED